MSTWYIQYNGQRKPLSDWGINKPILKLRSFQPDTLEFSVAPADINAAPVFPYDAIIDLYQGSVRRFRGRVTSLPVEGKAASDRNKYVASGPWWEIDNVVYQQIVNVPTNSASSSSPLRPMIVSNIVLFQTIVGGVTGYVRCSNGAEIRKVLQFLTVKIAAQNPLSVGSIDPSVTPPFEEAHDMMCSEVIKRCIRWSPDSVCYFDYSTANPTIHVRSRGALSSTAIDLNAANLVTSFSCGARYDLLPSGITIYLQSTALRADGEIWNGYTGISDGDASKAIKQIVMTVPIDSTDTNATDLGHLAAEYWNGVKTLQYAGDLEIREIEPTFSLVPGKLLNFTNGRAEFASMNAVIQQCEIDLEIGATKATFGPPEQLGRQDLLELIRNARTGSNSSGLSSSSSSGLSGSSSLTGGGMVSLQICDSATGQTKTISVQSFGDPTKAL